MPWLQLGKGEATPTYYQSSSVPIMPFPLWPQLNYSDAPTCYLSTTTRSSSAAQRNMQMQLLLRLPLNSPPGVEASRNATCYSLGQIQALPITATKAQPSGESHNALYPLWLAQQCSS